MRVHSALDGDAETDCRSVMRSNIDPPKLFVVNAALSLPSVAQKPSRDDLFLRRGGQQITGDLLDENLS